MAFQQRVFSGVQPTGNLHLGNYLGAIVKFVALCAGAAVFYFAVAFITGALTRADLALLAKKT